MYFGIAIVLGIIFIIGLLVAIFSKSDRRGDNYGRTGGAGAAVAALLVLGIVTALFSATTVDARSVGIQTSFGKYDATLDNGFHWTAPWSNVEQFSTQVQYLELKGDGAVPVSFLGGSSGTASVVVRWSIDSKGAEDLWKKYKTFDNVRDQLVRSEAQNAFRTTFSNYTPVDAIDGNNLNKITADVQKLLAETLGKNGVAVDSVSVTNVGLGDRAQTSLDRIVAANADVERATAEQEKAKIEAETARIRAESQTPESLQRYCLEVMNSWNVNNNGPLPATFNCLSGDSNVQTVVPVG